jgi:hypothetical protein
MPDVYSYEDVYFGLAAPADGEQGWAPDEQAKVDLIGRLFQRIFTAVGQGVIAGGVASIVAGNVAISELESALVADDLGAVPIQADAETILGTAFAEGDSYVQVQATATARADGTCGYVVTASETPLSEALVICKVTVAAGTVTAVDNTVKAVPAIADRIPWEVLQRNYDDATTLLAKLREMLGTAYVDASDLTDVATRLAALEAGGGGGGGGTTQYWGLLTFSATVLTTIVQFLEAGLAQHVVDYHSSTGGGGTVAVANDPWDNDAYNQALSVLTEVRAGNPEAARNHIDAVTVVPGTYGDGSHGSPNYIDEINSTWPA